MRIPFWAVLIMVATACSGSHSTPRSGGDPGDDPPGVLADLGPRFVARWGVAPWPLLDFAASSPLGISDLDGDGLTDLWHFGDFCQIAYGPLDRATTPIVTIPGCRSVRSSVSGDVDGDGDLDVVVWRPAGPSVLIQTAPRAFVEEPARLQTASVGPVGAIQLVDVDGDTDIDIVWIRGGLARLLLNDGAGSFTDAPTRLPSSGLAIELLASGVLTASGLPDLVLTTTSGQLLVLRNLGGAVFEDATATSVPALLGNRIHDLELGDVDGDGDVDILMRGTNELTFLANDGFGAFVLRSRLDLAGQTPMFVLDDDADGDLDVALTSVDGNAATPRLLRFDTASGSFVDVTATALPDVRSLFGTELVAWGDLDADGRPDLIVQSGGRAQIVWQDAGSEYRAEPLPSPPPFLLERRDQFRLAVGNFAGDASLDILVSGKPYPTLESYWAVYQNDGGGRLVRQAPGDDVLGDAAADLDGDGLHDVLLDGGWRRADGLGGFDALVPWPSAVGSPFGTGRRLFDGDFDGDGDVDVILDNGTATFFLRNDGVGGFTVDAAAASVLGGRIEFGHVVDLDRDGVDDIVIGTLGEVRGIVYGNRSGALVSRTDSLPNDLEPAMRIASGDWDGDGDVDLFVARQLLSEAERYGRIYENDGAGRFELGAPIVGVASDSQASRFDRVAAAILHDFDADGRAELIVQLIASRTFGTSGSILAFERTDGGEGAGVTRIDDTKLWGGTLEEQNPFPLRLADLDDDLDLDLIGSTLRYDTQREARVLNRPRFGGSMVVRVVDRDVAAGERALVLVGLRPIRLPLFDAGFLLVDPASAVIYEVDMAAHRGFSELSVSLPLVAGATAQMVYVQALYVGADNTFRGVSPRASALVR